MANPVVTLLADGGDITIGRRVSSFIYGVVNVTAAEGVDTPDDDTGLEQGYICRADGDVPRGRFDFNFARHDAQMRMATEGGDGSSDMEQGIVAASRRSSGDVFFERDIESAGFGRWVPGRDFNVGDTVGVRLWGRTIPLPVTSLSLRNGRWVAHVGGQMIHDAEKLKSQNQSIEKTIADERRRQRKETKAIAGSVLVAQVTADSAKQGAEQAQVTAAKASDETQHLRGILSGEGASPGDVTAQLAVLAEQLEEHGEASPGGLIPAYIAANTRRWELQEQIDETQNDLLRVQSEAQDALARQTAAEIETVRALVDSLRESQQAMLQAQHETLSIGQVQTNSTSEFFNYEYFHNPFHFTSRFTAKGSWRGKVSYQYARTSSSNVQQMFLGEWQVPDSNGSRVKEFDMGTASYDWFYLQFEVENGVQKTRDITQGRTDTPQNNWYRHANQTFTAKITGSHAVYWEVTWDATTYHNQYAIRVTTSKNRTLGQWGPHTKVGPLLPGFDGSRTHYLRLADQQLQAGEQVFFETFTDATEPSQRAVRATMTKISWIEEN